MLSDSKQSGWCACSSRFQPEFRKNPDGAVEYVDLLFGFVSSLEKQPYIYTA